MKKVFFKIEPFIKYFLIFIFFLFWNIIIQPINLDEIWNYGFAYNIYEGLIPYKDFNMVLTPFYPMVISFFFMLFGSNLLVMHIVNSLLITFMLWLIEKILKLNICVFVLILCFPLSVAFPSYNLFLLFLFVLIICLEKNNKSDFVIGVILGIFILTKQSVGVCLALPSIYYLFFDSKKFLKRILGIFIPCIIFLLYLLFTGSLYYFFDLCLFGMFDFVGENGKVFNIFFFLILIMVGFVFYKIKKDPRNISNYYVLLFSSITLPLFDINHFEYFLFVFLILFLDNINVRKKELAFCSILFSIFYIGIFFTYSVGFNVVYPNHYNNFSFRLLYNGNGEFSIRDRLNRYINDNIDKDIVLLGSEA